MPKGYAMNHQPFENWLLSEDTLSPENTSSLRDHLESCDHCRELETAWTGVVGLFQDVPDLEPAPGFVNRWQARLEVERQVELSVRHRWQSIIMLILIGNVIVALVVLFGTQFLTTFDKPLELVLSGIYRIASIVTFFNAAQNVVITLFKTITSVVPVGIWALMGLGLVGSGAIWIISLKSLSVLPWRN
jgi:hypothetical protein